MRILALVAALLAAQDSTGAPPPDIPPGPRTVAGRVVRPVARQVEPVPGAWVTLHRVGTDRSGPIDSVRTSGGGRYAFSYEPSGNPDAVYFVSVSHGGIAYFSPPLRRKDVSGDDAEITVFDTTSARLPIRVRGRHVIISASSADETRSVLEVFELSNDTTLTLVAGPASRSTWTTRLPRSARNFRIAPGEVGEGALSFADGRALLFAPIAPGLKQVAFSYSLPANETPIDVEVEGDASVLEVLIEDPRGAASGANLAEVEPVSVEGRNFRRFLAQDVPARARATISLPPPAGIASRSLIPVLTAIVGAVMLLAFVITLAQRRAIAGPAVPSVDDAERLARDIAELDAAFERHGAPTDSARQGYVRTRDALKARLVAALARKGART